MSHTAILATQVVGSHRVFEIYSHRPPPYSHIPTPTIVKQSIIQYFINLLITQNTTIRYVIISDDNYIVHNDMSVRCRYIESYRIGSVNDVPNSCSTGSILHSHALMPVTRNLL